MQERKCLRICLHNMCHSPCSLSLAIFKKHDTNLEKQQTGVPQHVLTLNACLYRIVYSKESLNYHCFNQSNLSEIAPVVFAKPKHFTKAPKPLALVRPPNPIVWVEYIYLLPNGGLTSIHLWVLQVRVHQHLRPLPNSAGHLLHDPSAKCGQHMFFSPNKQFFFDVG